MDNVSLSSIRVTAMPRLRLTVPMSVLLGQDRRESPKLPTLPLSYTAITTSRDIGILFRFAPKLIATTSSASTVDKAVSVCIMAPMLMGPPSGKYRKKTEDALRVYTKAVDVSNGSP